ncbi:unnamed protein product [Vicia faba]|uniref:Uncharacterized protein n=1 Tax=Vicia faba TaxID=3906 RepID=A0AAV1BCD8_VICFA|nr:unnamed protein product [Vicia faba]
MVIPGTCFLTFSSSFHPSLRSRLRHLVSRRCLKKCHKENMESVGEVVDENQMEPLLVHLCASVILARDFPFHHFELEALKNLYQYLNPNILMPPRNVIEAYVSELYMKEKLKLKHELATSTCIFCKFGKSNVF